MAQWRVWVFQVSGRRQVVTAVNREDAYKRANSFMGRNARSTRLVVIKRNGHEVASWRSYVRWQQVLRGIAPDGMPRPMAGTGG